MPRGGPRPGAGRPPGARNYRSRMIEEAARRTAGTGIMPVEFLLTIMRDEVQPMALRIDAAKAAAPYVHPRLISQHLTSDANRLSHDDWVLKVLADDAPAVIVVEDDEARSCSSDN